MRSLSKHSEGQPKGKDTALLTAARSTCDDDGLQQSVRSVGTSASDLKSVGQYRIGIDDVFHDSIQRHPQGWCVESNQGIGRADVDHDAAEYCR